MQLTCEVTDEIEISNVFKKILFKQVQIQRGTGVLGFPPTPGKSKVVIGYRVVTVWYLLPLYSVGILLSPYPCFISFMYHDLYLLRYDSSIC